MATPFATKHGKLHLFFPSARAMLQLFESAGFSLIDMHTVFAGSLPPEPEGKSIRMLVAKVPRHNNTHTGLTDKQEKNRFWPHISCSTTSGCPADHSCKANICQPTDKDTPKDEAKPSQAKHS